MRHFLALPAILRTSILLASASQHTFSVHDDLLAFPQYEVKFVEDYLTELQAHSKLRSSDDPRGQGHSDGDQQIEQYRHSDGSGRNDGEGKQEQKLIHEHMVLDGQPYLCSIPQVKLPREEQAGRNDTLTKAEEERELARATDRGWELLSSMSGNCVYFISGWWSYRFCYGQGVRQFHQLPPSRGVPVYPPVEDPTVGGFQLGLYQGEKAKQDKNSDDEPAPATAAGKGDESEMESALDISEGLNAKHHSSGSGGELVQRGENRYLVQRLGGGTKCDLTGKDRKTEVQFHCNPQSSDRISLIKETSTCAYLMVIQTPRLCDDVAFLPPQKDQPNSITCAPVLKESEIEDYERDLKDLKEAEQEAAQLFENEENAAQAFGSEGLMQIAGDILIGGNAIVPKDLKLEKGAIVGGGKETYIDTVASSDGRTLSEEHMKKLGLGDPKAVEKLRKELEKIAKGESWKLDVIDTPRGREYRGIIGDDDEKEKDAGKKEPGEEKQEQQETKDQGKDQGNEKQDEDKETANRGSEEEYYKEEL
ncbi:hypothetical protein KC360_g3421 [Hortaea werneckii]|nr:hypothetical protein KC325_g3323 [Hortaea werneckii]KAI6995171.1 hypothetical protein KC359_g4219 [Hortaea werneckii]KAI7147150.1 hypothetical protein KC344_g3072 [Hortaea werneckii]KAI7175807.1 hypothetical protein KC360_g3421 [Hortaea werneckii]